MKIALICTEKLPVPSIRGGAIQILIDGYLPYLASTNSVTVFCVEDEELKNYEIENNVEFIRVPRDGYQYNVAKKIASFYKSKIKFDLIHVFNRPKDLLIYKSSSPESRFILSLHNEMFKEGKISFELGNLVINACDKIITVSKYIANTVIHRFPNAKEKTIPFYSGVDVNRYTTIYEKNNIEKRNSIRKKYGINNEKVILFVGRLSKVKGVDVLIEAFSELQKKQSDTLLLIVGSKWFSDNTIDDYGKKIRDLVLKNKLKNVVFTGFIKPAEIPDVFLAGDIFVCASQWQEPLARVHYEAMATGLPIITTNRGGNAELFINNSAGIVIDDYSNPSAFCCEIDRLLNNQDICLKMSKESRSLACDFYNFSCVYDRIYKNYCDCFNSEKKEYDYTSLIDIASEILQHYPIVFDSIEVITYKQKKTIYKIHTNHGYVILKRMSSKSEKMNDMVNKIQMLINRNFITPSILKTYEDEFFIENEDYYFIMFDYIEGRKPSYQIEDELKLLVTKLAEMHLCCEQDYYISDDVLDSYFNKCINLQRNLNDLFEKINQKSIKNEFDKEFCESFLDISKQYNKSMVYIDMLINGESNQKIPSVVCHNDYVAGNTTIDKNGTLHVFDMDSLSFGIGAKDFRKLCNKIMKELDNGWDWLLLKNMYDTYCNTRKMNKKELLFLFAELEFPHLMIEQIDKYYNNCEPNWTYEKYLHNFIKAKKSDLSKSNVLKLFVNYASNQ